MGKKNENEEQELDLEFRVRIKTHGKLSKHVDVTGEKLAQICGLNFMESEVRYGEKVYVYGKSALVDSATYTVVSSEP